MVTKFRIKLLSVLLFTALVFINAGCGKKEKKEEAQEVRKLNIVATTGIIGDALENICQENADVTALMGPGVDPHLYKASESDVARLDKADVIVYNGLHLEGKMGEILGKIARTRPVINLSSILPHERLRQTPEFHGLIDPHFWFDVELWSMAVMSLGQELAKIDTAHQNEYIQNATEYSILIFNLHSEVIQLIASIPPERRVLITAHDAFGYFGRAYDIEVLGLQGISTVSEYGLQDVTNMVDLIINRGVKAIFIESSVSSRAIDAVIAGVHSKGGKVLLGGTLHSDALGEKGTAAENYIGMIHNNVLTIVPALQ